MKRSTMEKVVDMLRVGRYGRACRIYARANGTSPRLLKGEDRKKWIREWS